MESKKIKLVHLSSSFATGGDPRTTFEEIMMESGLFTKSGILNPRRMYDIHFYTPYAAQCEDRFISI